METGQLDRVVRLHPLVYLEEADAVTVGRPDVDSYAIFPPDGAELVRRLAAGTTPRQAAQWYADTYGEPVDVAELLDTLAELEFIRPAGDDRPAGGDGSAGPGGSSDPATAPGPVRWQRLGRALFSPVAFAGYALLVTAAIAVMAAEPDLAPHYDHIFFTDYYSVIELTLFLGQIPLMLVHEGAHALAGRRLGLRSRLSLSHRLGRLVLETSLDGLVVVPRRKRYLPMLAGIGADVLTVAALTLVAAVLREPDGSIPLAGRICLALAFGTVLRTVWQFYFFLRTDLYHLFTTVFGCVDLHTTAMRMLRNRVNRWLGRQDRRYDESLFHPVDRRIGRWYSWLVVVGYAVGLSTLVYMLPAVYRFASGVLGRFFTEPDLVGLADSVVFLGLNVGQLVLLVAVMVRERRNRAPQPRHVIA
ncbi:hypothetical protein [Plantactinospora sp. B5E13]|uniref:hypothetical protein n=1 Tax=Plantactinospora sp. B5E13 TaxID=3153758 RepID=UPI00325D9F46